MEQVYHAVCAYSMHAQLATHINMLIYLQEVTIPLQTGSSMQNNIDW